jgi:hypothetical protein
MVSMVSGILAMGRKQAEALQDSTCVITRVTGTSVDPATGLENPTVVTVYSGPCRLKYPFIRPELVAGEGQMAESNRGILSLPIAGTAGVQTNDVATVTMGVSDPGAVLVGRIESPFAVTHATARRFPIEVKSYG